MKWLKRCLLVGAGLALGVGSAELAVRSGGFRDVDGNFFFRGHHLRPYRLPIRNLQARLATYQSHGQPRLEYDPKLGWAPRPGGRSGDGLYCYNDQGVRSLDGAEVPVRAPSGKLRVALFGDSFVEGAEVKFEDTWGFQLQEELRRQNSPAEVLNFGVGGYGMDQALLRWKHAGRAFSPEIVIFGLQLENLDRNLNLIRPLYFSQTDIPISKPRFILKEGQLVVINQPCVPPDRLPQLLENIWQWEWVGYEGFLRSEDYLSLPLERSRALAYLRSRLAAPPALAGRKELALAILSEFQKSVGGQRFQIVYLPRRQDLRDGTPPFVGMVEKTIPVIHTEDALTRQAAQSGLMSLFGESHYSPLANRIVAQEVARYLRKGKGVTKGSVP